MATKIGSQFFEGETGRNTRGLLRLVILCFIAAAAISSRLFSVIRFESIIHECEDTLIALNIVSLHVTDLNPSRPLVQLQSNEIPRSAWLLQLLGLV